MFNRLICLSRRSFPGLSSRSKQLQRPDLKDFSESDLLELYKKRV
jgi:hypothetical protein